MPMFPLKPVETPSDFKALGDNWLADLNAALTADDADWQSVTRETLFELAYPGQGSWQERAHDPALPAASRLAMGSCDPANITLEPEYYAEVDRLKFARVKPLLWLWYSFDRLPVGGQHIALGVEFRRLLAPFIFARVGDGFKCFQNVEFSFGYNMEVGDNVVVHRHVLLDDRGGITMGDRVSVADYVNIYSHTHSIIDQRDVTNLRTVLEDDARITYHATVLAGVRVGCNGMVGAGAVATKDVRPYHVNVGVPAKSVRVKASAPPVFTRSAIVPELPPES